MNEPLPTMSKSGSRSAVHTERCISVFVCGSDSGDKYFFFFFFFWGGGNNQRMGVGNKPPPPKKKCIGVSRPTLKIPRTLEVFFFLFFLHKVIQRKKLYGLISVKHVFLFLPVNKFLCFYKNTRGICINGHTAG